MIKIGGIKSKRSSYSDLQKGNTVIFPAIARDDHRRQIADEIHSQICEFSLKAPIPIPWFLFQLQLDQIFCQCDIFVVIKSKCEDIGKSLQIKVADDAEAALMYYHDLPLHS